jgi:ABC-type lipoprotein release transport system permease subunit
MMHLFKMAFRDLGRNRRRSFFSSLALGMGVALLILMASVIEGEMRGAMDTSIKLQSAHLQVRAASYEEGKSSLAWEDLIEDAGSMAGQIAALPPVKAVTPRLLASGILSVDDQSIGVGITGIDPGSEANQPFRDGLVSGEYFSADDRAGILIGKPLAEKSGLKAGSSVRLLVNTSDGSVDEQVFTVRGVYSTGTPGYDKSTVLMPLAKAQTISRTEGHASLLFILLHDREQTNAVAAALQTNQYQVRTWLQANEILIQTEEFSRVYMSFLYIIILAITATVIVNTLVMAVFERTREIGILAAIGMKGPRIMAMFFAESTLLAVGGIVLGLILGGLLALYAATVGFHIGDIGTTSMMLGERIYGYLTVKDAVSLSVLAFIITMLASLYPAVLAARMEPVEALHGTK